MSQIQVFSSLVDFFDAVSNQVHKQGLGSIGKYDDPKNKHFGVIIGDVTLALNAVGVKDELGPYEKAQVLYSTLLEEAFLKGLNLRKNNSVGIPN
jgi:hypothetical protein